MSNFYNYIDNMYSKELDSECIVHFILIFRLMQHIYLKIIDSFMKENAVLSLSIWIQMNTKRRLLKMDRNSSQKRDRKYIEAEESQCFFHKRLLNYKPDSEMGMVVVGSRHSWLHNSILEIHSFTRDIK